MLKLCLPPLPSTPPISEYLPLPLLSRSVSDGVMDGSDGATGAPCPRQLFANAAALSATSASVKVLTMVLDGCLWDTALAHFVQHNIPKCQRLQKVKSFIVGRGVHRRASRVFSPDNRRRRGSGRELAMGSPSLPIPRLRELGGSVPGGIPAGGGDVGAGLGVVVRGVFAGRSKD